MTSQESLASLSYKGQPLGEVMIEVAIKQDQILKEFADIKVHLSDLNNKKADKTEVTAYEQRLSVYEDKIDLVDHRVINLENKSEKIEALSVELKELSTTISEQIVSSLKPVRDQVKSNVKTIEEFKKERNKFFGILIGAGMMLQIAWFFLQPALEKLTSS